MSALRKHNWLKNGILLLLAALLPLVLAAGFTLFQSHLQIKRLQQANASILLHQAEKISDEAWNMVSRLRHLEGQTCEKVEPILQRYNTQYAYFRAIGITNEENITCSSAFGNQSGTLQRMILSPLPNVNRAWWSFSVAGTYAVPDRPAVLFYRKTPNGSGSYTVVEAQYIIDFMRAIHQLRGDLVTIRFGSGYKIEIASDAINKPSWFTPPHWEASSKRYAIRVSITSAGSEIADMWRLTLLTFIPMALIFSLLFVALVLIWLKRKMSFRDDIRRAITHGEFSVNYQPVYYTKANHCAGVEALMRWQRANGEWVRPDIFIDAAEREEMIIPLTRHLLDLIVEDSKNWQVQPNFHIGINVAAAHLQHPQFVDDIRHFAKRMAHLQPLITLELTERSLISDGDEVINSLKQLRSEGMRIAIDDFGTGHCSLSYLQTFPLDYLKIDQGFVNAIESEEGEAPIIEAIISLSHKLSLDIVAEGVETPMHYRWLRRHGVNFMQGYLYARPMTGDALMEWLEAYGDKSPEELSRL